MTSQGKCAITFLQDQGQNRGFGSEDKKGEVTFDKSDARVFFWSDTTITVTVPADLSVGTATVTVTPLAGESASASFTVTSAVSIYGKVSGDFLPFFDADGNPKTVQVDVLTQDFQVIGTATGNNFTADTMHIFYTQADPKAVPAYVLVGLRSPGDHRYPFTPTKLSGSEANISSFRQVIMGDFCLLDKPLPDGCCTTGLLTVDANGNPVNPSVPPLRDIKAYVQAADGAFADATLNAIETDTADVSFTAPSLFKPAWLVLETQYGGRTFAYTPAPPVQISVLPYTSDDLERICKLDANSKKPKPDCVGTTQDDVVLKPIASNAKATLVAAQDDKDKLLVARIRAPMGLEPTAILVTNPKRDTSTIVRRTLKPGQNTNLLQVDMTIMDQETADRTFGDRIGKRYLAVSLDVKNPTTKKLQFSKSAVYFDVDYVAADRNKYQDFRQDMLAASTLGVAYSPFPYSPPFLKRRKGARLFRFGLEQNVKHSPINYLSVLGSYDETTERSQQRFDTLQLLASVMNTIATGGIAGTSQFKNASALLSGVFLPGLKGIVLNDSRINRHRANLVAQTLQEVIQISAGGSASTIVLLPRAGILAFTDAKIPVMIQRVIDAHLETEVVTQLTETPIAKGECKVGYTKDQTREALGEPAGVTTSADGTSVFTYLKGPVAAASFNAGGSLTSCQQRSVSDQLAQATTLVEMNQTLTALKLTATQIVLTDDSRVVTDIPGVQQSYHFDPKGNKAPDYTLLFSQITAKKGAKKSDFDTFLETQAKALSATRSADIAAEATKAEADKTKFGAQVQYSSPDVANGFVTVTFKNSGSEATVSAASLVDQITFQGDKPTSVKRPAGQAAVTVLYIYQSF